MFVCVVPSSQPCSRDWDYPLWDVSYLRKKMHKEKKKKKSMLHYEKDEEKQKRNTNKLEVTNIKMYIIIFVKKQLLLHLQRKNHILMKN